MWSQKNGKPIYGWKGKGTAENLKWNEIFNKFTLKTLKIYSNSRVNGGVSVSVRFFKANFLNKDYLKINYIIVFK